MFREINVSKQAESGPKRRWYQSDYFDLYIFYVRHSERADKFADREFVGMQLCYDIRRNQRTLEWKKEDGFSHHAVSKGGGDTLSDHGASSALLKKGGTFDAAKVIDRFMQDSSTLPGQVKTFVLKKLTEYAKLNAPPPPTADQLAAAAQIAAQVEAEAAYAAEQEAVLAAKHSVTGGSIKSALAAGPVAKSAPPPVAVVSPIAAPMAAPAVAAKAAPTAAPTAASLATPKAKPVQPPTPVAAAVATAVVVPVSPAVAPAGVVNPLPSAATLAQSAPAAAPKAVLPLIEEFNLDDLFDKPT